MGWNIFGGIGQALSDAYHATEQGLYDVTRTGETLGYEVGTLIKKHHFIPLNQAWQDIGQAHENVPLLGNVSGRQFARVASSYGTQAIPFIGSFGHLASHPNENIFQKGSDIAFGILDAVPVVGDVINFVKKPAEEGISAVANTIQRYLRVGSSPNPHEWEIKIWQKYHVKPEGPFITYVPPNFWKKIHPNLSHPEPPWKILLPHVKIPPFPKPVVGRLPVMPLPKLPLWQRINNFLKAVSKNIRFVAPIERVPRLHGILNDIAKTIRQDLKVVGVAIDEDPIHILAHDGYGILHNIAITRDGRLIHYIEDLGRGVRKVGETAFTGGGDLFKAIRGEVDHIMPFSLRVANFLRSGTLLKTLAGLGIGLSVIGGLVPQGSTGSSTANTTSSSGSYAGGLGNVEVVCGQGNVNGYPAVIKLNGVTYYAYGTTSADQAQGEGIQYVEQGQLPLGTAGLPFPSDPNKVYFVTSSGVKTYDLSVGQQIKVLANEQCGVITQGQMNAGNVLQAQLQSLSSSVPSESATPVSSAQPSQAVSESNVASEVSPEASTSSTTPVESQPSSIFSNKFLWIGIAIIIIIIIIAIMR